MPPERILYKYISFDIALKIIQESCLLYSPPLYFNDPFDLTNSLVDTTNYHKELREWISSFPDLPNAEKRPRLNIDWVKERENAGLIHAELEQFKRNAGICCFSKSNSNTLMWSHYADKHAGVCLGFTINTNAVKDFTLLEVNYVYQVSPLNYFKDKPLAILNWLFTKSHIWEYEEEVRAVYSNQNGLIKFEKPCLREICFGLRTTESHRNELLDELQSLGYSIENASVMAMNNRTFRLTQNKIPVTPR